jgi:hypothetical protein
MVHWRVVTLMQVAESSLKQVQGPVVQLVVKQNQDESLETYLALGFLKILLDAIYGRSLEAKDAISTEYNAPNPVRLQVLDFVHRIMNAGKG